ncbi:conserved exported hypothetical protein [uncultured delta proteobacterium]|uniref:Uncharacterized protein n=1 Tax=uncultured delta proteobacterium TaxID=34034 RepID=A0A212JBX0_9DELT|nr:conserved exported hypothetical protein [uncultured delta proteobacterium]
MKRLVQMTSLVSSLALIVVLSCGVAFSAAPAKVKNFRLAHVNGVDSPQQKVAEYMNEMLAKKMPQYHIDIYPNSQLGGERDMTEAIQLGSLDLLVTATTPLANFVPTLMVGELLYLVQNYEHADKIYQGEIGAQFLKDINDAGMKGLGFAEVGFRHLANAKKPVNTLDDAIGMKLRVMENELHVAGWRALGVNAITMSWADAYAGMQQGTIDALEVPWSLMWSNSVYDISKNAAETFHIYTPQAFLMSEKAWKVLSAEEKAIWQECATEACRLTREYARNSNDRFRAQCEEKGMKVTRPDLAPWREKAKALYQQYDGKYGDMIRKIQALAK